MASCRVWRLRWCIGAPCVPFVRCSAFMGHWARCCARFGFGLRAVAVVRCLLLWREIRYFRLCCALWYSGVFSVGRERSVRLWAVLEPLAVWVSLPPHCRWCCYARHVVALGDLRTGSGRLAFHFLPYPCPIVYYFARGRCYLTNPIKGIIIAKVGMVYKAE